MESMRVCEACYSLRATLFLHFIRTTFWVRPSPREDQLLEALSAYGALYLHDMIATLIW